MVTQTDNTQRPATSKLDHHTSPATIAGELQELADAFLAMGDLELEPTLLSVGLQVVGAERSEERLATVAAIAGRLGLTPKLSEAAIAGQYAFHAGDFLRGPKVLTTTVADRPSAIENAESADTGAQSALADGTTVDLKALAAVCCGQTATSSFEVYTPREGEARGRLDGAVYVCDHHPREVAAAAREQGLVPYLVPLSRNGLRLTRPRVCGDGYDYVAGQGFSADSGRGSLAVIP